MEQMLFVANWKAYIEDRPRAKKLFALSKRLTKEARVKIVLAPPAPYIGLLAPRNVSSVGIAAQDISHTLGGAETGEVTAPVIASLGATYVLIGHSERRARGDTDEVVRTKLARALVHGLTPILCVGEKERDPNGDYLATVRDQIASALAPVEAKKRSSIMIAYEPVWAINQGSNAISAADLGEMVLYIRKVLAELMPGRTGSRATVLYGGSVEPANVRALAGGSGVDGFLVGHASVDPVTFTALVRALA